MNIRINFYHLFLVVALAFGSCQKDYLDPKPVIPVVIDSTGNPTVFFTADIKPIFNANCISCHNPGPIDLRDANAYSSLVTNASPSNKYVDTLNPSGSFLYQKMTMTTPPAGGPMPLAGLLPDSTTSKVLKWIQEGAKNN